MWSSRTSVDRRVRLGLESLDARNAPSGYHTDFYGESESNPNVPQVFGYYRQEVEGAPQITNFVASARIGGIWEFSGDVVCDSPGGLTITFGGEPESLQGVTVVTDENGHFTLTISLLTDGSDDGLATAQTTDSEGLESNVASCNIHPS